jgi:hypothetical protein
MLTKETSEELELPLPFDAALDAVAQALCLAAQVTDITAHGEGESFARLEIAVPSGFAKLNPACVIADVTGAGERERSHVSLRATAREGLIFQATARKALDEIRRHLPLRDL